MTESLADRLQEQMNNQPATEMRLVDTALLQDAINELRRQACEVERLENAIAVWRKHAYEVGKLLDATAPHSP